MENSNIAGLMEATMNKIRGMVDVNTVVGTGQGEMPITESTAIHAVSEHLPKPEISFITAALVILTAPLFELLQQ